MAYGTVLLTGGSGKLGSRILACGLFGKILAPSREDLDIQLPASVERFFEENEIAFVVHCAALARMRECEKAPDEALDSNIRGTANMAYAVLQQEKKGRKIRFLHISTDAVYEGLEGNYSEKSPTIPYNTYGWSKLGAECAVRMLPNHCIIRTSFFEPKGISFEDAATDMLSSKMPVEELVLAISKLMKSKFVGTINVAGEKMSEYERYKKYKPGIKKTVFAKVQAQAPCVLAKDATLNINAWKKLEREL